MKYLRYAALLALLALPLAYSQAEVRVGVGIASVVLAGPPACAYGYYPTIRMIAHLTATTFELVRERDLIGAGPVRVGYPSYDATTSGFDRDFDRNFDRRLRDAGLKGVALWTCFDGAVSIDMVLTTRSAFRGGFEGRGSAADSAWIPWRSRGTAKN